jgi:hypothetical protein
MLRQPFFTGAGEWKKEFTTQQLPEGGIAFAQAGQRMGSRVADGRFAVPEYWVGRH